MTKLSVVIITKNEEHNIERCIKSCLALGAEILVLDSHSTDGTVQLAQKLGATVHVVDWKGYGATKNEGSRLARHEWILSLDADEALDEDLQKNILDVLNANQNRAAYWLNRCLVFNGAKLVHGALQNEKRLRLYRKDKMQWNLSAVHEDLELIDKQEAIYYGQLDGSILHYSYKDEKDMAARLDNYARLSAKNLSGKGKMYLQFKKLLAPTFSFVKNYYFKKGFADGKNGKVFAKAQAAYVRKKYSYALQQG